MLGIVSSAATALPPGGEARPVGTTNQPSKRRGKQRDTAKYREALALLLLAEILAVVGVKVMPATTPEISFPSYLVVDAPLSIPGGDKEKPNRLKAVAWVETREHSLDAIIWPPALAPLPENPDRNTTRVLIAVKFDRAADVNSSITMTFDVPPDTEVVSCKVIDRGHCEREPSPWSAERGRSKEVVSARIDMIKPPTATVKFDPPPEASAIVVADLKHVNGLAYSTNRKGAVVRFPIVEPTLGSEPQPAPVDPVEVVTQVLFDGADEIHWTQNPRGGLNVVPAAEARSASVASDPVDIAAWDYQYSRTENMPPPNIIGARQAVAESDTNRVFLAGIALGAASAAAIGSIQAWFVWITSEGDLNTRRRPRVARQRHRRHWPKSRQWQTTWHRIAWGANT